MTVHKRKLWRVLLCMKDNTKSIHQCSEVSEVNKIEKDRFYVSLQGLVCFLRTLPGAVLIVICILRTQLW